MGHIFILFVVSLANAAADRYSLLQLPSFKRPGVADANASQWASWCWDGLERLHDREIFLIHIPKVAGCSIVGDLSKLVGRDKIWTGQVCWDRSTQAKFEKTVLMLRRPNDHLLSIYHQCLQPGPLELHHRQKLGVAQGQPGFTLPDFATWVKSWKQDAPKQFYTQAYLQERYHCSDPRNPTSRQLTCADETDHPVNIHVQKPMEILHSASVIGLVEAYHESICLFAWKLRNFLPSHCNCEDVAAWEAFVPLHITHKHTYSDTVDDYNASVQKDIEGLTHVDRKVYQAGLARFFQEMDELEKTLRVKVLCDQQRQKLLNTSQY